MAGEAIFIGYRRDDTADVAGRIHDAFARRFGRHRIFMDVDNLGPGAHFGEYIRQVLPRWRVALILIGPHWLEARDERGARRLDDPSDWVRVEIETALATPGLSVVPVLINGARMPLTDELLASLQPLMSRHAAIIRRNPDFHDDVGRLIEALRASVHTGVLDFTRLGGERLVGSRIRRGMPRWLLRSGAVLLCAVAAALAWLATQQGTVSYAPREVASDGNSNLTLEEVDAQLAEVRAERERRMSVGRWDGRTFRDCAHCPEMVVVPPGTFMMDSVEGPQRRIAIQRFAVSSYEVTFDDWTACVNDGGCRSNPNPNDQGWGRDRQPVINVSWNDAQEYVLWLSQETGRSYRLLSEAEWEYASIGRYSGVGRSSNSECPDVFRPGPVGGEPNAFGIHDMHGNVSEWVQDCGGAYSFPVDGTARDESDACDGRRTARAGGWYCAPEHVGWDRIAAPPDRRLKEIGLRVARSVAD